MTESKNIIQNLLEKPKQIISDIKTRIKAQEEKREAEYQQFFAPPQEGDPLSKENSWGTGYIRFYTWNKNSNTWEKTGGKYKDNIQWRQSH